MTRDEFMSQAVASGKSKDEIKKVYDSIESAHEFTDTPTTQQPQAPVTKPDNTIQRVGKFFTQDIPQANQQFGENFDKHITSLGAPTQLGDALGAKSGSFTDVAAGIPERAARSVGFVGSELGDLAGTATALGVKAIGRMIGADPKKDVKPLV